MPGEEVNAERWQAHREVHAGEKELAQQYRDSHADQHSSIARNLAEYKTTVNEWRQSISELRATFFPIAAHEAFEREVRAAIEALNTRVNSEREERRDQQALRTGERAGIVDTLGSGRNLLLLIVSVLVGIGVVVDIVTRLHP